MWKHLDGLKLADPGFATPGKVDILLGRDIFSCVVFHGLQFGPSGSLSTIKTQYGWVLAGAVNIGHASRGSTIQCYTSTIVKENFKVDNTLRKFWKMHHKKGYGRFIVNATAYI